MPPALPEVTNLFIPRKQGFPHSRRGLSGLVVPVSEPGFPVPHRPAESEFIERFVELRVEPGARSRVRAGVTPEFADVHRASVAIGPFLRLLQRTAKGQRTARVLFRRQR